MKKIKTLHIALLAVACASAAGCSDYLEQPERAGLTPEVVFRDFYTAEQVLSGAYAFMPAGIIQMEGSISGWGFRGGTGGGTTSNMCDESDICWTDNAAGMIVKTNYQQEGLTPTTESYYREDKWAFYFMAIRNCYLYLANIDQVQKNATPELIARRKAEAKAVIAVQYFEVFKRFGGIPWVPGLVAPGDPDAIQPRLSVEESVNRMCGLLDEALAEPNLPQKAVDSDLGRASKTGVLMLKAVILMYAASPLYNTEVFPTFGKQELVRYTDISPAAVKARWTRAKEAAQAAIAACNNADIRLVGEEEDGTIDPEAPGNKSGTNFKMSCDLMTYPSMGNTELVWGVRVGVPGVSITSGSSQMAPSHHWNMVAGYGNYPSYLALQNMVDQYELTNGEMQPANQYETTRPYDNLEARFKQSVLYHGAVLDKDVAIPRTMDYVYLTGDNYPQTAQNFTAYNQRKFLDDRHLVYEEYLWINPIWPYLRLADLYLIMAEASNEADDQTTALLWLNKVRQRAGQPKLEDTQRWSVSAQNKAYLRACIKNDRLVELAFEQHRYFDLKRWLMGPEQPAYRGEGKGSIGGQMYWMRITGSASAPTFTRTPYDTYKFTNKFYFYPIPQADINKSGSVLVQNPGW